MDTTAIPVLTCRDAIMSEDVVDFFRKYRNDAQRIATEENAICFQYIDTDYIILHSYVSNKDKLQRYNYLYSTFPKCYGLMDTSNIEQIGVNRIRRQPNLQLFGKNILIGFLDTGIDYTNSVFKNADGTSRILAIWDQTIQAGAPPSGQLYGTEYTKEQIDEALNNENPFSVVPSTDTNGHGTFMAGVAAGNIDNKNNFSGVAPQSEILMVKMKEAKQLLKDYYYINQNAVCYQETDVILGVRYLLNKATQLNKPIVICLGMGTNSGGHKGTGLLEEILDEDSKKSDTCIVVPTGNESNYGSHFRSTIPEQDNYVDVEINVGAGERGFVLELWAEAPSLYSVGFLSPSGEYIQRIPPRVDTNQRISFVFDQTIIYVEYRIIELRTGDELIFMRFESPSEGIWKVRVFAEQNFGNEFDMWLPIREFLTANTQFLKPDPDVTITGPGNTRGPITAAGYNHTNNAIYINSGRGFTRAGGKKPDITAPAVNVYGSIPNNAFTTRSGTSIAAAHVAGGAALLMEWGITKGSNPYINTSDIKALMIRGAKRGNIDYPSKEFGYGTLDVYGALESLIGS